MIKEFYWLSYLVKYKLLKRRNRKLEQILQDMDNPKLWLRDGYRLCNPNNNTSIWVANSAYGLEVFKSTCLNDRMLDVPSEYKYLIWQKYLMLRFFVVRVGTIFDFGGELIVKPMLDNEYIPATKYLAKVNKHLEEIENAK